jgi:hypothetical protein
VTSLLRDRSVQIEREARRALGEIGASRKIVRLNLSSHLPMAGWRDAVRVRSTDVDGTAEEVRREVLGMVRLGVSTMEQWLRRRGADTTYGFEVVTCLDVSAEPGWRPDMGHYALVLEWVGPKPSTWPHPVTEEDVVGAAKDDDAGYISDYRNQNPEGWDAAKAVLAGGKALKDAAAEAAKGPAVPRLGETA